jgi:hypothetical protein
MVLLPQLTVGRSMGRVADFYSRAWNLGCATNILRSLPQELRDMVYKELVTLQNLYPNREEGNRQVKRQSSMYELNRPELQLLLSVKDYSHFFDKHFMGIEFATELS